MDLLTPESQKDSMQMILDTEVEDGQRRDLHKLVAKYPGILENRPGQTALVVATQERLSLFDSMTASIVVWDKWRQILMICSTRVWLNHWGHDQPANQLFRKNITAIRMENAQNLSIFKKGGASNVQNY